MDSGIYSKDELKKVQESLLNLAMIKDDDGLRLVQQSLHLLIRFNSSETTLFEKAIQTELLTTKESIKVFEDVKKDLPSLRRKMGVAVVDVKIAKTLDEFTKLCTLKEDNTIPHRRNQKILYNFGVVSDVINYMLQTYKEISLKMRSSDTEQESPALQLIEETTVFKSCFGFLRVLAKDNITVKQRIYEHMDDLLEIKMGVRTLGELLTEVFTGGCEICLKVTEVQVERIFDLIAHEREGGRAGLIRTLQAMAKVEQLGLPLNRNQAFIIKYFSQNKEKFFDGILGDNKDKFRRELLLKEEDSDENLTLLLAITDLLASCADGESIFIDSVCQKVLSIEELLSILNSNELPHQRKRPFVRFLVCVFMDTVDEIHSSGAAQLSQSLEFWKYLDSVVTLLRKIEAILKEMQRLKLTSKRISRTSTFYIGRDQISSRQTDLTVREESTLTDENKRIRPDVLLYLVDGILPLILSFYTHFFNPNPESKPCEDKQLEITSSIYTSLLQMCESLVDHISTDGHMKLYRRTVLKIKERSTHEISPTENLDKLFDTFKKETESCRAKEMEGMTKYKADYKEEEDLNSNFNKFVSNFKQCYEGLNEKKVEDIKKNENKFCDFFDEERGQPGDEYLPLGQSFQELVDLFEIQKAHGKKKSSKKFVSVSPLLRQLKISSRNMRPGLSEKELQRQQELDIKCLQILRSLIHNKILRVNTELIEEDSCPEYQKKCIEIVQPVQNAIQDSDNIKAIACVVPMLSHPNDSIVRETLAFLRAILYSGNRNVQKGVVQDYLLQTREEKLFIMVRKLFLNTASIFKEKRMLLRQFDRQQDQLLHITVVPSESSHSTVSSLKTGAVMTVTDQPLQIAVDLSGSSQSTVSSPNTGVVVAVTDQPLYKAVDLSGSSDSIVSGPNTGAVTDQPPHQGSHSTGATLIISKNGTVKQKTQETDNIVLYQKMIEHLAFRDSHHAKIALQVLGLMCDEQYREMQNYLREQKNNIHQINIVREVASFLQHFYLDINQDTMELVHHILQALIEMCGGNYYNQVVLHNTHIVEVFNHIFAIDITSPVWSIKDAINLKGSAIELLEAMMEETSSKTKDLMTGMAERLYVRALHDTMVDFHILMKCKAVKEKQMNDDAERGLFRTYHVLVKLMEYGIAREKVEPKKPESNDSENRSDDGMTDRHIIWDIWEYCRTRSKSVEISYKNMEGDTILTKVSFPVQPNHKIQEDLLRKVKWNVKRDSPEDKQRDFIKWMKAAKRSLQHRELIHKNLAGRVLTQFSLTRHVLLWLWSVLMNILLLASFILPPADLASYKDFNTTNNTLYPISRGVQPDILPYLIINGVDLFRILLSVGGSIHLFMTLWFVLEYFVINWPNFRLPRVFPNTISRALKFFERKLEDAKICKHLEKSRWQEPPEKFYTDVSIFGLMTIYTVLFLTSSVLSLVFHGYFYCFCLLHIIVISETLQRVLRSIVRRRKSLLLVSLLGVTVLYIYSVISFAFLSDAFMAGNGTLYCNTLYECFVTTIRHGLIDNLGLVIPLVPMRFEVSALRLFYDLSFFILMTTIGLSIIFGIIVDSFAELRNEKYKIEEDEMTKCFICGLDNHEFERRANGFKNHIQHDHNMWTYILYSFYLDQINPKDHSAIQSFVHDKIEKDEIDFFPLLKAKALKEKDDDASKAQKKLHTISTKILQWCEKEEQDRSQKSKQEEQQKWEKEHLKRDFHESSTSAVQSIGADDYYHS